MVRPQRDPAIYTAICNKHPEKIYAIYIRNVHALNEAGTRQLFESISNKQTFCCLFRDNAEAIDHARTIGLIV